VFFWCILLLVCTSTLFYFSRMMPVKLFLEIGICMCWFDSRSFWCMPDDVMCQMMLKHLFFLCIWSSPEVFKVFFSYFECLPCFSGHSLVISLRGSDTYFVPGCLVGCWNILNSYCMFYGNLFFPSVFAVASLWFSIVIPFLISDQVISSLEVVVTLS